MKLSVESTTCRIESGRTADADGHPRQLQRLARRHPAGLTRSWTSPSSVRAAPGRGRRQCVARPGPRTTSALSSAGPPASAPAGQRRFRRGRQRRLAAGAKSLAARAESGCGDREGMDRPGARADRAATTGCPPDRRESSASASATPTARPRARSASSPAWPGRSASSSYRAPGGNTRPVGEFVPGPVDWVTGACMLVNTRMMAELGGMDEDFFLYHEEVALSRRAQDRGWRVEYDPEPERRSPTSLAESSRFRPRCGSSPGTASCSISGSTCRGGSSGHWRGWSPVRRCFAGLQPS